MIELKWDGGDVEGLGHRAMDMEVGDIVMNIGRVRADVSVWKADMLNTHFREFANCVCRKTTKGKDGTVKLGILTDVINSFVALGVHRAPRINLGVVVYEADFAYSPAGYSSIPDDITEEEQRAWLRERAFTHKAWVLLRDAKTYYASHGDDIGWKLLSNKLVESCSLISLMVLKQQFHHKTGGILKAAIIGDIWHYDNADFVINKFGVEWLRNHSPSCRHALISKYCQSGKTEVCFIIAFWLIERLFVHPARVFFLTGFADGNWRAQTIARVPDTKWVNHTQLRGSLRKQSCGISDPCSTNAETYNGGLSLYSKVKKYSEFSLVFIDEIQDGNDHAVKRSGKTTQMAQFLNEAHTSAISGEERGVIVIGVSVSYYYYSELFFLLFLTLFTLQASMELQRAFRDRMSESLAADLTATTSDAHFNAMNIYSGDNSRYAESIDFCDDDGHLRDYAISSYLDQVESCGEGAVSPSIIHLCYLHPNGKRGGITRNAAIAHRMRTNCHNNNRSVRVLEMCLSASVEDKDFFSRDDHRLDINKLISKTCLTIPQQHIVVLLKGMVGAAYTLEHKERLGSIYCPYRATPMVQQRLARFFAFLGNGGENGTHDYHTRLNKPLFMCQRVVLCEWLSFTYGDDPRNPLRDIDRVREYHITSSSYIDENGGVCGAKHRYTTGGEAHTRSVRQRLDQPAVAPTAPVFPAAGAAVDIFIETLTATLHENFGGIPANEDSTVRTYIQSFNSMLLECGGDLDVVLNQERYPLNHALRVNRSNRSVVLNAARSLIRF